VAIESVDPGALPPLRAGLAFEVSAVRGGGWTTIRLDGELDLATAPVLSDRFAEVFSSHPGAIVLDLAELRYCDSAGIRVLLSITARCTRDGVPVRLTNVRENIRRVFELMSVVEALDLS